MWRDLWKFITAALTLARDIEETRTELKEMRQELHRLALAIVQMQGKLSILELREQAEREKLGLQLQLEQKQMLPVQAKRRPQKS